MKTFWKLAVLVVAVVACESKKKEVTATDGAKDRTKTRVVTAKYADGTVRAEISYLGDEKHGLAKSYDQKGKLTLELNYVRGKREGVSKKYYEGGKQVYQTTEYKNDNIHGLQRKYREDGALLSEARFIDGQPCQGLKEYLLDGTEKKKYPEIVIKQIDRLQAQGFYRIEVSMSAKVGKVRYYRGKLSRQGCITDQLEPLLLDRTERVGIYEYDLPPGGFFMEELNIVAQVETLFGNAYIVQRSIPIAIQN